MAYSKLVVCGRNYAIGYQTVNQARDNVDSQFEAFRVWHGVDEYLGLGGFGRTPPPRVRDLGHHDDERIPRASVRVSTRTSGGFVVVDVSPNRVLGRALRGSAGTYAFEIRGLREFWAMAVPIGAGVSLYNATCQTIYPSSAAPYLQVMTFIEGSDTPTDANFTLTIYGNP